MAFGPVDILINGELDDLVRGHRISAADATSLVNDYRYSIPQLFTVNGFVMLSNGSATRIGSSFAPWEHFFEWKRINEEALRSVEG